MLTHNNIIQFIIIIQRWAYYHSFISILFRAWLRCTLVRENKSFSNITTRPAVLNPISVPQSCSSADLLSFFCYQCLFINKRNNTTLRINEWYGFFYNANRYYAWAHVDLRFDIRVSRLGSHPKYQQSIDFYLLTTTTTTKSLL